MDERVESPPPKPVEEPAKVEEQQPAEVFEQKVEKTPEPEIVPAPTGRFSGNHSVLKNLAFSLISFFPTSTCENIFKNVF